MQSCDLESHIAKFHEPVSRGPLYIISCCDQLWYKHSVVHILPMAVDSCAHRAPIF